jgi:putative transcriptional regulator
VRIALVKRLRIEAWSLPCGGVRRAVSYPVGTLRDWEQRRYEPDQAAQAYLKVIAADAAFVARALAGA